MVKQPPSEHDTCTKFDLLAVNHVGRDEIVELTQSIWLQSNAAAIGQRSK